MKISTWIALGLISLLAAHAPISKAGDHDHTSLSKRVIMEAEKKFGPEAARRVIAWNDLIMNNQDRPNAEKLKLANDFFNRIPVKSEEELWGHKHWSTPYEMLVRNVGSHADHAIAKYVTLEAMGVAVDHMQLTHVHAVDAPNESHLVLTYRAESRAMPYVLDTLINEVKPASERRDLVPEHSLNETGLWLSDSQADGRNDAKSEADAHIELWNDMNARMDKELLSVEDPSIMW